MKVIIDGAEYTEDQLRQAIALLNQSDKQNNQQEPENNNEHKEKILAFAKQMAEKWNEYHKTEYPLMTVDLLESVGKVEKGEWYIFEPTNDSDVPEGSVYITNDPEGKQKSETITVLFPGDDRRPDTYWGWDASIEYAKENNLQIPTDEEQGVQEQDYLNIQKQEILPGHRNTNGSFYGRGDHARLWSSTESSTSAWSRYFFSGDSTVFRDTYDMLYGFSVRCLKG
ncbi:MAG: hypothetical protein U9Q15_00350 [Patescibacteria group bacterium]|nr:hypothetical protein [Patescibacteria group bacterium]